MTKQPKSIYAKKINDFIGLKRKLGHKFSREITLLQIDKLALELNEIGPGITKEFSYQWCKARLNEAYLTTYDRVSILRQFSQFLLDAGIETYVPKLPIYKKGGFIPHIYSQKELREIFDASDRLVAKYLKHNSGLISIPCLFRLLYSTGIRISEALALKLEDVCLDQGYLKVKDCKNGKERIIPISDTLISICRQFLSYRTRLPLAKEQSIYFFIKRNGERLSYNIALYYFNECLRKTSIQILDNGSKPRIHDLRHTFAVNSMVKMCREGMDMYLLLPILSTYLGHSSVDSTNHYVRLARSIYPEFSKQMDLTFSEIFPKLSGI